MLDSDSDNEGVGTTVAPRCNCCCCWSHAVIDVSNAFFRDFGTTTIRMIRLPVATGGQAALAARASQFGGLVACVAMAGLLSTCKWCLNGRDSSNPFTKHSLSKELTLPWARPDGDECRPCMNLLRIRMRAGEKKDDLYTSMHRNSVKEPIIFKAYSSHPLPWVALVLTGVRRLGWSSCEFLSLGG